MLINLHVAGKDVLVVGGGAAGERKVMKFLEDHANITVAGREFTFNLKRLGRDRKVKLFEVEVDSDAHSIDHLLSDADLVVAATNDQLLNERIVFHARDAGALVCAVDNPHHSDISFPATTNIGDIRLAVYTGGKSPAMARVLCHRMAKTITNQDILQVRLQDYARTLAKSRIASRDVRRKVAYTIIRDKNIRSMLRKGLFEEAKILAKKIVEQQQEPENETTGHILNSHVTYRKAMRRDVELPPDRLQDRH